MSTLDDVAKLTGFSSMTISRYFNSPERLKPETRKIISAAVAQLNYTPNSVAKSLAKKCSNIIYVYITPNLDILHPFVQLSVTALGERLGENGYSLLLSRKPYTDETCDGIVAVGITPAQEGAISGLNKKPLVVFGSCTSTDNRLDVDNYRGSYDMTQYLIGLGCSRIAYIGVGNNVMYGRERWRAYRDCLNDNALPPDGAPVIMGDNKEPAGYAATKRILESGTVPDAIECASDLLAIGCIRALNEARIPVPEKVMVTGFDGLGYEIISHPHITTVRQPIYEAGQKLADMMLAVLSGKTFSQGEYIAPTIVEHSSTRRLNA